jgi:hypothetical protein
MDNDPMESFAETLLMLKNSRSPTFESSMYNPLEIVSTSSHDSESDSLTPNKRPRLIDDDAASLSSMVLPSQSSLENTSFLSSTQIASGALQSSSTALSSPKKQIYRGKYRCGRCGLPKTNHVCTVESKFMITYCAATQWETSDATREMLRQYKTLSVRPRSINQA